MALAVVVVVLSARSDGNATVLGFSRDSKSFSESIDDSENARSV